MAPKLLHVLTGILASVVSNLLTNPKWSAAVSITGFVVVWFAV